MALGGLYGNPVPGFSMETVMQGDDCRLGLYGGKVYLSWLFHGTVMQGTL